MTFFLRQSLYIKIVLLSILLCYNADAVVAQVNYNAAGSYGIRKTVPSYTGSAVKVRRTCDDVTQDIGFTSCGQLDTVALKKFAIASNPLSAITSSATAAYSLRKLSCVYVGNAITVRRTCDNLTQDIGFTPNGDLDTITLKKFVLASNPLSAITTSATAAYSLRKLRCAYAGSAIRVRSSAAGTPTLDIGFTTNGDLDTNALKTFVGANSGYITTWYDQSGNNKHVTQTTAANQPRIINAGVIERQNGIPAIRFISASATTLSANALMVTDKMSVSVVAKLNSATARGALFDLGVAGGAWPDFVMEANTHLTSGSKWGFYANNSSFDAGAATSTNLTSLSLVANNTYTSTADVIANTNFYVNGTAAALTSKSGGSVYRASWPNGFVIGNFNGYAAYFDGLMTELIIIPTALSNTDRQYIEWTQGQYYNINGISLSGLTSGAASAYVTTWFDQSGNARNATQTTPANQPRIINAGRIEKQNTMPAVYFAGTTNSLFTANFTAYATASCFNGVAKVNTNVTYNAIVNKTNNNNYPCPIDFYNGSLLVGNGVTGQYNLFGVSQTFNSTKPLGIWTHQVNGTAANGVNAYYNGANILANQTASYYGDAAGAGLYLGSRYDGATGLNGWITEVVTFGSIPSTTDRAFLEWSQAQYYNISGVALGAIPAGSANAYVTTWYDQSGNGRNLTQPTAGNQPKIISSGKLSLQNGRPTIPLDGTSNWLIESTLSISNPYSLNTIATRTVNGGGAGGYQRLINISAAGDGYGYQGVFSGDYATFNGNGAGTWNDIAACTPLTAIPLHTTSIMTMISATGATGLKPSVNGTPLDLKNGTSVTATGFLVGGAFNTNGTSQLWPGTISEFNIFSSALSTTRINLLETNQAAYYAKTISNNKYTPPTSTSYNLFVNGIGRESATDSVAGTRSTTGMGVSVTTAGTAFLKDNGDYLTFGMNCFFTPNTSLLNLPATVVQRWENDWYINKTDVGANNGTMSIYFDFSDYGVTLAPGVAANYVLLYRSSSAGAFSIVPATTVTTSGDRVIFNVDAANILTNYYYTIGTKDAVVSPLPIELLGFNCAVLNSNSVKLTWSTASEFNSDYFLVERSSDAINYELVGNIAAAGNSSATSHYSLTDENALNDVSYYRLKSVDLNGTYKYSPLCSVTNQGNNLSEDVRIYPNPTNGFINIDFTYSVYAQPDVYFLMDITGKKINAPFVRNHNVISVDMSLLEPGLYMLEIIKGNKKSVKKITLQK